ncbi:MAG: tyrosine-type recombinase/integrase [bacterium]
MTLNEAFDSFLSELRRRGYSARTVEAYSFDLKKLAGFISESNGVTVDSILLESVDVGLIRRWADHCLSSGNSPRTLSRKMATCKSLFKYLVNEDIIKENPVSRVKLPKIAKKPPAALSQDEIRQLMNAPGPDDPNRLRDRAILLLLYSAGLRVSELVTLKMEQALVDRQAIRIHGKGAKDRILPLSDSCRAALIDYFLDREKKLPKTIDPRMPAFVTEKGHPMTVRMIQYMVEKYGRDSGISLHVYPHLIRHTIATHLIEEGCDVEAVRQTLGHENLATTSIYIKSSSKFLREEHKKFNPSDRLTKDTT